MQVSVLFCALLLCLAVLCCVVLGWSGLDLVMETTLEAI